MDSTLFLQFFIPIITTAAVGIFKAEITAFLRSIVAYYDAKNLREVFDQDKNESTPDALQLYNSATGDWGNILVKKVVWSISGIRRGVYIYDLIPHPELDWMELRPRKLSLGAWRDIGKAPMPHFDYQEMVGYRKRGRISQNPPTDVVADVGEKERLNES